MRRSAALFGAAVMAVGLATPVSASHWETDRVNPATYNLYVGADLFELLTPVPECAALPLPPPLTSEQCSVIVQAGAALDDVAATNYPERAARIAELMRWRRPDVIGLQEVSLITTIPVNPANPFGGPVGPPVVTDYLDILLNELAARGLNYEVAASVNNANIQGIFAGRLDPNFGLLVDNIAGLLDRDVILVREGVTAHADTAVGAAYQSAQLSFPLAGEDVEFTRSYVKVDVTVRGKRYAAVNTHLEVEFEPGNPANQIQTAQAAELMAILAAEDDPILLLGDFNSAPDSDNGLDGVPTAYQIIASSGYTDVWNVRTFGTSPGFTCCQAELLDNPTSQLDQRIDQIWLGPGLTARWAFANTVGDRPWQKTPSGQWPSDHAGVVAYLGLRR